jgi:formate dehydrogenase subunit gamma
MRTPRHDVSIVDRYTPGARINHWITAGSLILLALSGLAFFHPSLFFLTGLFGGGQMARMIHPWIGVVLLISFTGLFIRFVRFNFWNRDDTRWMRQVGDVVNARDDRLPEIGSTMPARSWSSGRRPS